MNKYPPTANDKNRLIDYELYEKIFLGDHFDAFGVKFDDFKKDYASLKWLTVNFGGMLSKLSADMLFEEFPTIRMNDKKNNVWLQDFMSANQFQIQCYESALEGSYRGDALFKIRAKDGKLIVEDVNPSTWFPVYDTANVRKEPSKHVFAYKVTLAGMDATGKDKEGVRLEIHEKGTITHELWQIHNGELSIKLPIGEYYPELKGKEVEKTNIQDFLVVPVKNYGINSRYFGISDYKDLLPIMYAIENRLTRTDYILDKHGDPILAVPKGVLDNEGKVRRQSFGLIEVDTDESKGQVPQYIVWDAKLDSAFKEIEMLVEFFFLTSETSRSAFGVDKDGAQAESGKALKYKLLRTIAKKHRKQLYYDHALKEVIRISQEFAKANGLKVGNSLFTGQTDVPEIIWQDGILNDLAETLDIESTKLDLGLTTKVDAISTIDGIDSDDATEKLARIIEEKKSEAPKIDPTIYVNKKINDEEE